MMGQFEAYAHAWYKSCCHEIMEIPRNKTRGKYAKTFIIAEAGAKRKGTCLMLVAWLSSMCAIMV
jgi:hypothetical protein